MSRSSLLLNRTATHNNYYTQNSKNLNIITFFEVDDIDQHIKVFWQHAKLANDLVKESNQQNNTRWPAYRVSICIHIFNKSHCMHNFCYPSSSCRISLSNTEQHTDVLMETMFYSVSYF